MHLVLSRVVASCDGSTFTFDSPGEGSFDVGPLSVDLRLAGATDPTVITASVANRFDRPVPLRSLALVFRLTDAVEPIRMFRNGYQSWSPTSVATLGIDRDPSTVPGSIEFLQAVHHADQRDALDGELRSEWVTVLADATGSALLAGFDGGSHHDGTFRLRRTEDHGIELWAEAFHGDASFAAGEQRPLQLLQIDTGDGTATTADASDLLEAWADGVGQANGARVQAPYQVGWCSWYHYFHDVTEAALRANLARASSGSWPFDVFQLDDGYQAAIGDWLDTNEKFPTPLDGVAAVIAAEGFRPGLWLAPFLVAPDSQICQRHPEWVARHESGQPLYTWFNPPWGGGHGGMMYSLDTTLPAVIQHLRALAGSLVDAGFSYLKLDFTFSPSCDGVWADPALTPAQRVRAGYQAVRDGAGSAAFILGCGVPLSNVVGLVDGNRIGQDVAPCWALDPSAEIVPGYLGVQPSTQFAYVNTVNRSFMHRKLWLNDPDCLMLRTEKTEMSDDAVRTWARTVGVSGGMALVSDDLALLGPDARALLDETLTVGRASDDAARAGQPAVTADLLETARPTGFVAAGYSLLTDPDAATSTLAPPRE